MKNNLLLALLAAAIIGAGLWYVVNNSQPPANNQRQTQQQVQTQNQEPAEKPIATAIYNCDGNKTITAAFYKGENIPVEPGQPPAPTGKVKLVFDDGKTTELAQTISADGGRYANADESFIFWDKGGTALVLENGVEANYKNCKIPVPAQQ